MISFVSDPFSLYVTAYTLLELVRLASFLAAIKRTQYPGTNSRMFPLFWKEGNVLFNDALHTFYLRLYDVGHMVKDHSDSEGGNPLPPYGLLFPISSEGSFICIIPQDNTYHGLCYTSRGALAGRRNSSMGPPGRIDPTTYRHHERTLLPRSHISPIHCSDACGPLYARNVKTSIKSKNI